ncbi:MAG TPA: hypothetical protein VN939_05415 [Chthoniobacterales bacterium]|nr:hypothetical protein [Chthoniobacterales bacterium]
MNTPNFWYVLVYDPSANQYIFFIRFNQFPGRNWGPNESREAAAIWARRLIQPDASVFIPGFDRLQVMVKPFNEIEAAKNGSGDDMGAGIKLWVQMAPPDSRLRNPVVFGILLNQLRNEVAAQVPPVVFPVR